MIRRSLQIVGIFAILGLVLACANPEKALQKAEQSITGDDLIRHVKTLASDEFQGRAPATEGETKTIEYLTENFKSLGLKPGNGNSYLQEVPLVEITADPDMVLTISERRKTLKLNYATEFIAATRRVTELVELKNSEMVFVGYGIVAPEYNWNDYEGLDVRGKTVVMLVNDPGYATGDSTLFNGRAMTYYGRWTYKYEEAARQGAAAAIIVHETGAAGYPWEVVRNSWSGPQSHLRTADNNMSRSKVEAWITSEKAREIFKMAKLDFDQLHEAAAKKGFKAVPMKLKASLTIRNTIRYSKSNNVLALLPGKENPRELIIYTAHWDHLGINPTVEGDSIFNGARDNATGTASLLEIAEAFTKLSTPPNRSILFLAVTAEEQGLLGSAFYADHPVYPLSKTIANINMDAMNIFGKTKDLTIVGYGYSELDDYARAVAEKQGRYLRPDPEPEKGYYFRSDHFNFAKKGIPALYIKVGVDNVEKGEQWMRDKMAWWTKTHYHKPSDEYDPDYWDVSGMVDDARLLFEIGYRLAMENSYPNWREGTEFKAIRDAMLKSAE